MLGLKLFLNRLVSEEKGVTTVEYAIMLVLVALAVAAFGFGISDSVTGVFDDIIAELNNRPS
ncbi:MAG TPA: Flp family type IVb pilin [Acidobacteriota bacterium]|nr:Flp family type IVb pilin [Acidobacteriota bacterium]